MTGGLVYADVSGGGLISGNFIGAGHLVLQIDHGEGSNLSFDNLVPGAAQTGDQLITGDLNGVGTADLVLTLSGAQAGVFTNQTTLTVAYSDPEPAASVGWSGGVCTPSHGYAHTISYANLAAASASPAAPLGSLTGTDDALCVRFEIGLPKSAGNDVQGASATFGIDYDLQQTSASTS